MCTNTYIPETTQQGLDNNIDCTHTLLGGIAHKQIGSLKFRKLFSFVYLLECLNKNTFLTNLVLYQKYTKLYLSLNVHNLLY